MAVEMLVGLNVVDEGAYGAYRQAMRPILQRYGGGFGYDFVVSRVLQSETAAPINRLFTIYFADDASREAFFADAAYQTVKQQYFDSAVTDTTIIATYERSSS